jgi:methyl-accepting chemotaxis protein
MFVKNQFISILMLALTAFFLSMLSIDLQASESSEQETASDQVLALSIEKIAASVDAKITSMKILANTIANDAHIHQWVDAGFSKQGEQVLIDKLGYLVKEYDLTSASFADTNSHKYWNHEGFLRVLTPEIDTWYYAYLKSGQQDLISVYHDKNNNRVDLYVNYRQQNGLGLSGIATSFDGVVGMLRDSTFGQHTKVFIVDSKGRVQVHPDPKIAGQVDLQTLFSKEAAQLLLMPRESNVVKSSATNSRLMSSYIPSMNWYVVAELSHYE